MSEGNGKVLGGAAVGVGGAVVVMLKAASAPVHVAEIGVKAAAVGGREAVQVGAVGARAGSNAGTKAASALAGTEGAAVRGLAGGHLLGETLRPLEQISLKATSELPLHAVDPASRVAAKTAASKAALTPAMRESAIRKVLAKADHVGALDHADTALDVLQNLADVWDFATDGGDAEKDVTERFRAEGLDFRGDIVPAYRGEPFDGLQGATRTLLTDGKTLVPALRLSALPVSSLDRDARIRVVTEHIAPALGKSNVVYVAHPLGVSSLEQLTGATLLRSLATSAELDWRASPLNLPNAHVAQVVEINGRRYEALVKSDPADDRHRAAPTRAIFVDRMGR